MDPANRVDSNSVDSSSVTRKDRASWVGYHRGWKAASRSVFHPMMVRGYSEWMTVDLAAE